MHSLWETPADFETLLRDQDFSKTAIVLVHGYLATIPWFYWAPSRPLWRQLKKAKCKVVGAGLPATGKIEARARRLGATIRQLRRPRVICVAHSMGGLDARYAAWRYDPKGKIETIITLNTPHLGTPVAEWAQGGHTFLTRLVRSFDDGGLRQLTPEAMARFNEQVPDRSDIVYRAFGSAKLPDQLTPVLRPYGERLQAEAGANDGLVPTASARRDDRPADAEADHLEVIGHRYDSVRAVRDELHITILKDLLVPALLPPALTISRKGAA